MAFANNQKARLDSDISAWVGANLLGRDWTIDTAEYHLRAREHLKEQAAKFTAMNRSADAKKLNAILDNENRRDLVIELLWDGAADLDLKVREPIGSTCSSTVRQTPAGGVLLCDDFAQKEDDHSETYTASEAYSGSYYVTIDKVWGRPLGNMAMIKITKHKGTPQQAIDIFRLDLTKQTSLSLSLDSGRRKELASVLPPGVPIDSGNKPEREYEVMNKLRAMTTGTSAVMNGLSGGTGSASDPLGREEGEPPLVDLALEANIASSVSGGLQMRQETIMSKDRRSMQVKMAPVFAGTTAKQTKVKLDFIPGAD